MYSNGRESLHCMQHYANADCYDDYYADYDDCYADYDGCYDDVDAMVSLKK